MILTPPFLYQNEEIAVLIQENEVLVQSSRLNLVPKGPKLEFDTKTGAIRHIIRMTAGEDQENNHE